MKKPVVNWVPIKYSGFWDYPLGFYVDYNSVQYLFERHFDDVADEYPDQYNVYKLPSKKDCKFQGDWWGELRSGSQNSLGVMPIEFIQFDPTHRLFIDASLFTMPIFCKG